MNLLINAYPQYNTGEDIFYLLINGASESAVFKVHYIFLIKSFQTITCTGNDKYIMHSKHPTDPLADFKTPATLIHTYNSLDSRQFCIKPTKCVVIWPTTSCFADWSKRRHVTLRIIDCQEGVLTCYRIFITCQLTSWHVDKCQGVFWHVVNILRCFCLHFFWDVFFHITVNIFIKYSFLS